MIKKKSAVGKRLPKKSIKKDLLKKKYSYKNIAVSQATHERMRGSMVYSDTFDSYINRLMDIDSTG